MKHVKINIHNNVNKSKKRLEEAIRVVEKTEKTIWKNGT